MVTRNKVLPISKTNKKYRRKYSGFLCRGGEVIFFLFWTIDMFYFPPLVLKGASYAIIFQCFQNWGWQQNNTKILNKILHIVLLHLLFHNFKIITTFSRTFVMKWRLTVLLFHETYICTGFLDVWSLFIWLYYKEFCFWTAKESHIIWKQRYL